MELGVLGKIMYRSLTANLHILLKVRSKIRPCCNGNV